MANMVTLIDGRTVSSSSPEWREECLVRHRHVETLQRMRGAELRDARRAYLRRVGAAEGEEAQRRLEAALLQAWRPAADSQPEPPSGQT